MFARKSYGDCTDPIVGEPHSHRDRISLVSVACPRRTITRWT
jgi:hypothetical protein